MSTQAVTHRLTRRPVHRYAESAKACGISLVVLACFVLASPSQAAEVESEAQLTALKNQELALADRLMQAFPQKDEPLIIKGNIHARHGNTDLALKLWSQAVLKNPQCIEAYHKMAEVAVQMDQLERAIALWRKILEVDPKIRGAHIKIADAMMNLGDYEQSIAEALKETEVSGTESIETGILLGRAYQQLKRYELARQHYEHVIALDPAHMNAYYGLYNVCARLKDRDAAQQYMARYRDLKAAQKAAQHEADEALPSDVDCFYQSLAKFYFDSRSFYLQTQKDANVEPVLKAGMSLGKSSPAFLKRLAELYTAVRGDREALALYVRLAQLTPDDTSCYVKIGVLSVQLGLLDMAEKAFGEVVTREPEDYIGYQELSRLYLRMKKNLPEARSMAEKAVTLKPSAPAYYDLALACFANQDLDSGLTSMERAVELDPRNPRYTKGLALFKQKKGDVQ